MLSSAEMTLRTHAIATFLLLGATACSRDDRNAHRGHPDPPASTGSETATTGSTFTVPTTPADPWEVTTLWQWNGYAPPSGGLWKNVFAPPTLGQLTDDDNDGDIDADDVPDVVVSAFGDNGGYVVAAIDGRDGSLLWAVEGDSDQGSSVAVVDIVGDARPEVLSLDRQGHLHAFTHRGEPIWTSTAVVGRDAYNQDPIVAADLDADGVVEILVSNAVIDGTTGDRLLELNTVVANTRVPATRPIVADLDGDGVLEIISGHRVFESDGAIRFGAAFAPSSSSIGPRSAVVQANGDPDGEVLFLSQADDGTADLHVSLHGPQGGVIDWA